MRRLPFLLVLLLSLLLLAAAASAQAFRLPAAPTLARQVPPAEPEEAEEEGDEEADDGEGETGEGEGDESSEAGEEGEDCGAEADELCEESGEEASECLLKDASASLAVVPGAGQVRLTVRYEAYEPATVVLSSRLHGPKGSLNLGSIHARFAAPAPTGAAS